MGYKISHLLHFAVVEQVICNLSLVIPTSSWLRFNDYNTPLCLCNVESPTIYSDFKTHADKYLWYCLPVSIINVLQTQNLTPPWQLQRWWRLIYVQHSLFITYVVPHTHACTHTHACKLAHTHMYMHTYPWDTATHFELNYFIVKY